ncbi:MAG: hypothetical protein HQL16_03780 [Candidatus Omnitrophica bacterium]|nr:hypothetical protein [Candidatus Omnitrophota bacterium]
MVIYPEIPATLLPLFKYFKLKASDQTGQILKEFITLENWPKKGFEFSSDSAEEKGRAYLRAAFSCLKREEILRLFSHTKFRASDLDGLMFENSVDPCFGMGIADYKDTKEDARFKLYSVYLDAQKKVDQVKHIHDVCKRIGLDFSLVGKDLDSFKEMRACSVDLYDNGVTGLKLYTPFLQTEDILGQYSSVFDKSTLHKYEKLLHTGILPETFLFCIRYGHSLRSARTDFSYRTTQVAPYLQAFDLSGAATRLYQELLMVIPTIRLAYISMDLDKRLRTQFYFEGTPQTSD